MRRNNNFPVRPKAHDSPARMRAPEPQQPPTRKVFNCIVDDTALIAGVKKSTRDGIRKWVSQGAIRLFVPLHTLAQLDRLKKGKERVNADAGEAIKWLDDITSMPGSDVILEGVDEAYNTWGEVEQFLLPDTLLSMEESDSDDYSEDLDSSYAQLDISDDTSVSSSHSLDELPKSPQSPRSAFSGASSKPENGTVAIQKTLQTMESPNRTARNSVEIPRPEKSSKGAIPSYLQPLFNHIVWRIHKESNPEAAMASFILLTDDTQKQVIAQKFGIRAKRLQQLREAVAREDREYRNHLTLYKLESEDSKPHAAEASPKKVAATSPDVSTNGTEKEDDSDDEDVVLFRAPKGPQAQAATTQRVLDPNDFGRANPQLGGRGGRGGFTPRGRGASPRGRGAFAPRGGPSIPSTSPFRKPSAARYDPNQPIDPDSFARPTPRTTAMRGDRRKLWEPN